MPVAITNPKALRISRPGGLSDTTSFADTAAALNAAVGYAQQAAYTGMVATRGLHCDSVNGSLTQMNSRSNHTARVGVNGMALKFPNFYLNTQTHAETGNGAPVTITAAIEYPLGTYTLVTFNGGATSAVIPDLAEIVTDSIPIQIPKNTRFWVHAYRVSSGPLVYSSTLGNYANGDGYNLTAVDQTMTAVTISPGSSPGCYFPSAIIGKTAQPSIQFLSDSRGDGATVTNVVDDMGEVAGWVGPSYAYANAGISGDSLNDFLNSHALRVAAARYCSHVVIQLGINDLVNGASAATVANRIQQVAALFPSKAIILTTKGPWTSGGNTATDASNPERIKLNNLIRGGLSPATAYVEVADVVENVRDGGFWKPGYTDDDHHPNGLAQAAIGAARAGTVFGPSGLPTLTDAGTAVPTIVGAATAGVGTYATRKATWTRNGSEVTVRGRISWSAHTGTGNMLLKFTGLPPMADTSEESAGDILIVGGIGTAGRNQGIQFVNLQGNLYEWTGGSLTTLTVTAGSSDFIFGFNYRTA